MSAFLGKQIFTDAVDAFTNGLQLTATLALEFCHLLL